MSKTARKNITSLILCSPNAFSYENDYQVLDMDDEMLEIIRRGPMRVKEEGSRYAYVFGDLFDVDTYDHPGYFEVETDQIGFVELKGAKGKHKQKNADLKTAAYEKKYGPSVFDDSDCVTDDYLKKVQATHPEIVWIAPSNGSKFSHVHFHVDDSKDRVDSVIIDMNYFFDVDMKTPPHSQSYSEETDYSSDSENTTEAPPKKK